MNLIKGADVVSAMTEKMQAELSSIQRKPCLAIIRVGEKPDDMSYERGAKKRMEKVGIDCISRVFDAGITDSDFKAEFAKINADDAVDGILILRPLPKQIDEKAVCGMIDPKKDVDCINPVNIEKVFVGERDAFAPCTAEAVMKCIDFTGIDLCGKNAVVVGRSLVVGKPLSMLLLARNATVTICHSRTQSLPSICSRADVLVSCIGRAMFLKGDCVKKGAYVFDVGINLDDEGNLCGDFDVNAIKNAAAITPVPGGVGSVTTAVLAEHVIRAAKTR